MRRLLISCSLAALLAGAAGPAAAQSDTRVLYDRIDRLERDLQMLQASQARGGGSGSMVIKSPALGGDGQPISGPMATRLDERLDQLEEQLRQLTGKVEENQFRARQAHEKLERLQADMDLRFKDLQAAGGGAAQATQPPQAQASLPAAGGPAKTTVGSNSAEGTGPAPGPQPLGVLPAKDAKAAVAAAPTAPVGPSDPQALYDQAYAKAQKGDYGGAERDFQTFLAQNPKHALAGNAQYWVGDIAFARKDFKTAAATFAEAYKKYPQHSKAPDMLFKLAASFGQLNMKTEACSAYGLLYSEHPKMPDRVRRSADADKKRLGCK